MAYQLICETEPVGTTCTSGWVSAEIVPTDVAQIVELLSFDLSTFSTLMGTCVLFFIMGHYGGHVARTLGRL